MRVLIVNRYMSIYGGAEQVVRELSLRLSQRGIDNLILALNISEEVKKKIPQATIVTPKAALPYALRSASLISSLGIVRELYHLRRLIKRYYKEFDLINLHNFPANWVGYGLGKPTVWMCNEIADFYNNPRPSPLVRAVRTVGVAIDRKLVNDHVDTICVADGLNAEAVRLRYGRDVEIVPYGIEPAPERERSRERQEDIRNKYGIRKDDFVVLQVGVVSPTKNQRETVDALAGAKGDVPDLRLILAGDDANPYGRSLKEEIKERGLTDKVVFTGRISKEEVYDLYSVCNLSAFPVKLQGGYLSVFEAISASVPVIVSPRMGAAGIVASKGLGIVSDDLTFYIKDIHRQYSRYKQGAQEAARWVRSNLTWDRFADRLIGVFNDTLNRRQG